MTDVVDPAKRSQMMAGIGGKNTTPELIIRKGLHARGFRYRLHDRSLPGRPDLVFRRYKAVILVNGCFWHGHGCHLFKWPATRVDFWRQKISDTIERDRQNAIALDRAGWRVLTIWECALKGKARLLLETVIETAACWLLSMEGAMEIKGRSDVTD
ncbi:MAG: very short patch repair endonuclease [Chloroflexi bacterium]|nr:very short patch repair endonuclease [Chloroflexota bacterium]